MTNSEKIIDKIRKLKAKADDGSVTEEEASLYAEKVAALLQQHNLSEAALEIKSEEQEVTQDKLYNSKTGDPWAQTMARAIANLYFCDIFISNGGDGKTRIAFVGKPHNIEVAKSMTEYLIKTIGRLANAYTRLPSTQAHWDYTFSRAKYGFERGAGLRMYSRIMNLYKEQNASAPQTSTSGNPANLPALYQNEAALVKNFMDQIGLSKNRGRGADTSGHHAANGAAAANGISLSRQVGSKSSYMIGGK